MRRTRFALALPFLLPIAVAPLVRADNEPKPAPVAPPVSPDAPKPDAPKPDAPKPDAAKEEPKKAPSTIAWLHDYDEAKTKAAEEKKGLFVYLTPTWFT